MRNSCGLTVARTDTSAAFDNSAVTELAVYNLDDGAAPCILPVAGRRCETGQAAFLVCLLD